MQAKDDLYYRGVGAHRKVRGQASRPMGICLKKNVKNGCSEMHSDAI